MAVVLDSRAVSVWLFDEQFDAVLPKDSVGNLIDLEEDSTLTRPSVGTTTLGFGRVFTDTPTTGLEVVDTNDDLSLTSSVSIVAIVALDVAGQDIAATPGTIIQRGRDTEETELGLMVTVTDAANEQVLIQMFWEDSSGTLVADVGVVATWPTGEEFLIAAIREVDGDLFQVRYVVNRQARDGATHTIDVGSSTGASVFVGVAPTGASAYQNHLVGTIAMLEVFNGALAVEEVQLAWLQLAEDAPRSRTAIKKIVPRGPYGTDESLQVQRELDIESALLGILRNDARQLRDFFLPNVAFGGWLATWEKLTGRKPFPSDSIDTRQERIFNYLSTIPGLELVGLLAEMLDLLGYTDPLDIDLITATTDTTEDFSTAVTPGSAGAVITEGNGTFTVSSSRLNGVYTIAEAEFLFGPNDVLAHLFSFTNSQDVFFGGSVRRTVLPVDVITGFLIGSEQDSEWMIVGLRFDGVDHRLSYRIFKNGTWGGVIDLFDPANGSPTFFRFRHKGSGTYDVQFGGSDIAAQAAAKLEITGGPVDPLWAGFSIIATTSGPKTVEGRFDDWYSHEGCGIAPISYYLFRDPADPGTYDIEGAHRKLQEIGHAHFEGFVVDQLQLTCDDTDTGCDRNSMGL